MKEKNQKSIGALVSLSIFAVLGSFWRRLYGGGFGKLGDITRFWKYLVMAGIVLLMYYVKGLLDWHDWRIYAVIASFAYHWARSIGDWIFVYDHNPDPVRIKWINWILRHIFNEENYYSFWWNVCGLFIRYTATSCIVSLCIPNAWFCVAGVLTTLSYVATGKMENPTDKAKWLAGALNFGLLYLCIGG